MDHSSDRSGRGRSSSRGRGTRGGRTTSSGRGATPSPSLPPFQIANTSLPTTDSVVGPLGLSPSPTYPSQGEQQQPASPASQIGDDALSDGPVWGTVDPATGKMWIRPLGTIEFEPYNTVKTAMDDQLFRNYNHPWGCWTEIPRDTREAWCNALLIQFRWLPHHKRDLEKAYHHKASRWLCDRFSKLRKSVGKQNWIHKEAADALMARWASDEKWQAKSAQNKKNRACMEEPSYAGGSIPISQHRRKIEASGTVPPELIGWETFRRTHSSESAAGDTHWINSKSVRLKDNWDRMTQERETQSGTDPTSGSSQSDNESLFLQAAGGFDKRGRVFGLGASASRLKQVKRASIQIEGVSADELKRMKALVQTMEAGHQEQQTQMQEKQENLQQQLNSTLQIVQQQAEAMRQMQVQLQALMSEKGKGTMLPPDDDDDDAEWDD